MTDELDEVAETDEALEVDTPEEPQERTFTQAELDEVVKKVKRKARRAKPRAQAAVAAEVEAPKVDDGSWRDDFYDATHGRDIPKAAFKRMRTAFRNAMPEDPDSWVEDYCDDFKLGADTPEPKPEIKPEEQDAKVPEGPPSSDKGAPSAIPDYDTAIDPNRLSADDIKRMVAKYGKREAYAKIKGMVQQHYTGRSIVTPP